MIHIVTAHCNHTQSMHIPQNYICLTAEMYATLFTRGVIAHGYQNTADLFKDC